MKSSLILALATGAILTADAASPDSPHDLALRMLNSIKERGQSTLDAGGSTGFIQLGLFWQALAVITRPRPISAANDELRPLLEESLTSSISAFSNVTKDAELPLDRLSLGASMAAWTIKSPKNTSNTLLPTLSALNDSLALQPRNANGGLWYYNNVDNITAYQNLSYLDGMYSYAPYITVASQLNDSNMDPSRALDSALQQIQLLYDACIQPSGLLVHGYDAAKAHAWANSSTGASPEVWGRSLAWYSLGLLNTLEAAALVPDLRYSKAYGTLRSFFQEIMSAQLRAVERSKALTGVPGVWQVVDRPGEEGNYIEASSSFMTTYTLLRSSRLDILGSNNETTSCEQDRNRTESIHGFAEEIYDTVSQQYLIRYSNGSLSLNGTSSVASLSPQNVSYEYYITRPTELDSLIGTSAFALASYEIGEIRS